MTEMSTVVLFPDPDERAFLAAIAWLAYLNPFDPRWAQIAQAIASAGSLPGDRDPDALFKGFSERLQRAIAAAAALLQGDRIGSAEDMAVYRGAALYALWDKYRDQFQHLIDTDGVDVPFRDEFAATYKALRLDMPVLRVPEPGHLLPLMFQWRRNVFYIAENIGGRSPAAAAARVAIFNANMGADRCVYARGLYLNMERIPVLITGETGTGKDLAAQCIGWGGYIPLDAKGERFVIRHLAAAHARNLCEVPRDLIESALFGHKKGSFTGATADAPGFFTLPERHGSLFLDEIGELPEHLQAKLLRPCQNREIVPLGATRPRRIHGRYIFATHRDLEAMCREGTFRMDLLERINGVRIHMPPLRQMIAEDPWELVRFVRRFVRGAGLRDEAEVQAWTQRIADDIFTKMAGYSWPRNLRELKNFTERYLLADGEMPELQRATSPAAPAAEAHAPAVTVPGTSVPVAASAPVTMRETPMSPAQPVEMGAPQSVYAPESVCVQSSQILGEEAKKGQLSVDTVLAEYVTEVFLNTGENLTKTAKLLKLHRQTVAKLIDPACLARLRARRQRRGLETSR
jgi:DNA-binding NtrC family response regulator